MVSLGVITVLGAFLLLNSGLAMPRAPHSPRFPYSSDNSVGEFVLWSCTATAQLQKINAHKDIIHIAPAAAADLPATGNRISSHPPSREDDDRINNIHIIKVNSIPHRNNDKTETQPKIRTPLQTVEIISDQGTRRKDPKVPIFLDTPLKTIKVNAFRKDMPVLFKEKSQLPQVEHRPTKEGEIRQHSSEITVIKM